MFLRVATAGLVCLALTHPSQAIDFSQVRCENPQMVDVIRQKLRTVQVEGGYALASYGAFVEDVRNVSTVAASTKKLVCGATLSVASRGSSTPMRTHITFQTRQDGKVNIRVTLN
jgi:hypothetical protein